MRKKQRKKQREETQAVLAWQNSEGIWPLDLPFAISGLMSPSELKSANGRDGGKVCVNDSHDAAGVKARDKQLLLGRQTDDG